MPRVTLQKDEHDPDKVKLYGTMKAYNRDRWSLDAVFHEDAIEDVFGSRVAYEVDMCGQIDVDISAMIIGSE